MPTELPTTEHELLPWLIGVLVLAGLSAAAYVARRNFRQLDEYQAAQAEALATEQEVNQTLRDEKTEIAEELKTLRRASRTLASRTEALSLLLRGGADECASPDVEAARMAALGVVGRVDRLLPDVGD